MTERDKFAAAALTGLLAQGDDGSFSEESYAVAAYRWADAMLRERERTLATQATPTQGSAQGEGTVPDSRTENEPVAWAVMATGIGSITPLCHDRKEAQQLAARLSDPHAKAVPLYRHPQPTLTDEEREAIGVAMQCLIAAESLRHPEEERERMLISRTAATLRKLLERLHK